MKDIRTTKWLIGIAVCCIVVAGLASLASLDWFSGPFARERFNRSAWLAKDKTQDGNLRRGLMAQDVMDHVIRPGMSADQVKELLGEPDSGDLGGTRVNYVLGAWDLDFVSTENRLNITLTSDHKVEDISISDN